MPNPKIVIVLTKNGVDSVTVSAPDSLGRTVGYELCRVVEKELQSLGEAVKRKYEEERPSEKLKQ
jgi:hypothetical protein